MDWDVKQILNVSGADRAKFPGNGRSNPGDGSRRHCGCCQGDQLFQVGDESLVFISYEEAKVWKRHATLFYLFFYT